MMQRNNETSIAIGIKAILFRTADDIRSIQHSEAFHKLPVIIR
jgi:hypothetical protein